MVCYIFFLINAQKLGNKLRKFFRDCSQQKTFPIAVIARYLFFRILGRKILAYKRAKIIGLEGIETNKTIRIGIHYKTTLILPNRSETVLHNEGETLFLGDFSLGVGSKINIEKTGRAKFGDGVYVNSGTSFLIAHKLEIGHHSIVSWDCQLMDENFHEITYLDRKQKNNGIKIGNHVWIGCGVLVLNGSVIPDGCVVAARSVVSKAFDEENCLIAGNPAQIIKRNISWQ
ncbi:MULTISPECIES: acyltransferase [Cyanophyceae]|uniref:Acyltransferase n=1 Tax=Leptolyngbya subtilissima DQ-A4 TaxID=2933933 RepID=A0ABV0JYZ8_9CYAN|nr:acyltransferase [Nodosilinea sp. FACHB-141]MBD2112389.1 acyltransferase [Nodosilinea sp. FACHB-141]